MTRLRPNNFDLIRLLAAIQVMVFHGIIHLNVDISSNGLFMTVLTSFPGVPIFFFTSGFLISAAYERNNNLKQFAKNRALRIFPALWVCFAFSVLSVVLLAPQLIEGTPPRDLLVWLVTQLSFFQFYNPEFLRPYGLGALNGSLWTIAVEFQFYTTIPILYFISRRFFKSGSFHLYLLIVLFLFINIVFNTSSVAEMQNDLVYKLISVSFLPYFWIFLLGILAQQQFHKIYKLFYNTTHWWLVAHTLFVLTAIYFDLPHGNNHPFPMAALTLCGVTLSGAYSCRNLAKKLLNGNDISYGIYIYHGVILNALIHLELSTSNYSLLSMSILTIILGGLSWFFIEKPCLGFKVHPVLRQNGHYSFAHNKYNRTTKSDIPSS